MEISCAAQINVSAMIVYRESRVTRCADSELDIRHRARSRRPWKRCVSGRHDSRLVIHVRHALDMIMDSCANQWPHSLMKSISRPGGAPGPDLRRGGGPMAPGPFHSLEGSFGPKLINKRGGPASNYLRVP